MGKSPTLRGNIFLSHIFLSSGGGKQHFCRSRAGPCSSSGCTTRIAIRTVRRQLPLRERELTYVDLDMFLATFQFKQFLELIEQYNLQIGDNE